MARIRRELGTTVILSEHRLEEALPLCDRVLALVQTVLAHGTPQEVSRTLRAADSPVYFSMPTPVRVSGSVGADECPVTVTEGRQRRARYAASHPLADVPPRRLRPAGEELLGLKDVWFRYEKDGEDVLQDPELQFCPRPADCPARRQRQRQDDDAEPAGRSAPPAARQALLPDRTDASAFCRRTRRCSLTAPRSAMSCGEQLASLPEAEPRRGACRKWPASAVWRACWTGILRSFSGGEQQRAALAKLLLAGPELLLLDEPTKGMDAQVKRELAAILNGLLEQGATVVMVSHDVEFCAQYADRCLLMFDGSIAAEGGPTDFFAEKSLLYDGREPHGPPPAAAGP